MDRLLDRGVFRLSLFLKQCIFFISDYVLDVDVPIDVDFFNGLRPPTRHVLCYPRGPHLPRGLLKCFGPLFLFLDSFINKYPFPNRYLFLNHDHRLNQGLFLYRNIFFIRDLFVIRYLFFNRDLFRN